MSVSPRGFSSTAEEVAAGIDLSGRRVVVTGAASGIGIETARAPANEPPSTSPPPRATTQCTSPRSTSPNRSASSQLFVGPESTTRH
jgi:hypothetical protein